MAKTVNMGVKCRLRPEIQVSPNDQTYGFFSDPTTNHERKQNEARDCKTAARRHEIAPAHKAMARELGYALTLRRTYGWHSFTQLAAARLAETERAALAFAALQSLPPQLAELTAAHTLGAAGCPLPPCLGGMDEARLWAACATVAERKAVALAAFEALAPRDQAAFLNHVKQKELAA